MAEEIIKNCSFSEIDLGDPFFDSLKQSYCEFSDWFKRKAGETAYVSYGSQNNIQGFLYIKIEKGPITDINPPLNVQQCLKVGTFKIIAHGTRLGERFVKIIVDSVLRYGLRLAYVTVFPEHENLIRILEKFGFLKLASKESKNGIEDVYVKDFQYITGDRLLDYPVVDSRKCQKWLLAIYPDFHTRLFPDSKLKTEPSGIIEDVSYTNSINKAYLGFSVDFARVREGDCFIIYRCQSKNSYDSAWFKSVATSLCVVDEIRAKRTFSGEQDFVAFCHRCSVFSENEIIRLYRAQKRTELYVIKMTYNLAFPKRPNLEALVKSGAVPHPNEGKYMGMLRLDDTAFRTILGLGEIHEGFVIN